MIRGAARVLVVIPALLGVASCALLSHGRYQQVMIDSAPSSGTVEVITWCPNKGASVTYTTPMQAELKRSCGYQVLARNVNGALVERTITSQRQGLWQLLDLGCCPIVCNLIDAATGADLALTPDPLMIPLPPPDAGPEYRSLAPR